MTNPFRAIGKAWRRWRLKAAAPLCPICGTEDPDLHQDNLETVDTPPMWFCQVCNGMWWQGSRDARPIGYCHERRWSPETWKKILTPPNHDT